MDLRGATPQELRSAGSLEELYRSLATIDMGPGWNKPTPSLYPEPKKKFPPAIWHYVQAKAALDAAGRLINTELAERRNLILANAGAGSDYATATTLVSAYQMIMPGEHARSHRHMPNALRLVVDAEPGTYTVVDGVRLEMMPGDVLLTPNWCWHGHGNDSKANGYWIDFLDVPLVHLLEPMFFEPNPDEYAKGVPPETPSPAHFPWAESQKRLAAAAPDPSGCFGRQIEFGHPAMATTALFMMKLDAGSTTKPYRTTANNIFSPVEGEGETVVEGKSFEWRRGDVFVVPAWLSHFHRCDKGAVLFRVTDEPTMQKLGFLREEKPAHG
ncbi:MAG TPA: cupin domain-containing protein [Stellaceae bacterium]|nr:cupin domain-containing protein [Stellaceae bacterium]